jgi:hypothetical protein
MVCLTVALACRRQLRRRQRIAITTEKQLKQFANKKGEENRMTIGYPRG